MRALQPLRSPSALASVAVLQRCACGGAPGPTGECAACRRKKRLGLQAKLRVGAPGDRYEREADRVADAVVRDGATSAPLPITPLVQRSGSGGAMTAPPAVEAALAALGRPLDGGTRAAMEAGFGRDFSAVRVHTGPQAAASAAAVQARAYTVGRDVVFGAGEYHPGAAEGRRLLAHELTHVVQQTQPLVTSDGTDSSTSQGRLRTSGAEPRVQRAVDPDVDARIVGHASPIWENPRGGTRERLNMSLSEARVAEVERYFRDLFNSAYGARGTPGYSFERVSIEGAPDEIDRLSSAAVGSSETVVEAGGNVRANDPAMRRVDVTTRITLHVTGEALASVPVTETRTQPTDTQLWAVRIFAVLTGGEGVGAGVAYGEIKNRRTGQVASGAFAGGGIAGGIEIPIPAAAPNPSWSNFTTQQPVTFADLDDALARLTDLSVGVGVAGYSAAFFDIDGMAHPAVYVGGFVLNEWGIGGASLVGAWGFDSIPAAPTTVTESIETEGTPFAFSIPDEFEHTVYFATGSDVMDEANLTQLETYVHSLIGHIEAAEARHGP